MKLLRQQKEQINSKKKFKLQVDWLLFFATLTLVIFGVFMVHSASSDSAELHYKDEYFFVTKQIVGAVIGLVCCIVLYFVDYHFLHKIKWVVLIGSIILLALVFVPKIGVENYGAKRWLNLGVTTIQPSEIAKFGFVIFAASTLSKNYNKVKTFKGILPVIIAGVVICGLIIIEPNMSITMCVGITLVAMLFVGGISFKHFLMLAIPAICLVPLLIVIEPYRLKRLVAFLDPWSSAQGEGFQLVESLYSLGAGGFFGVGYGNSRQKYLFLPFAESDFIFSIIGEELGFAGCLFVIIVFVIIVVQAIKIALRAKDRFGCLLASGIASVIAVQVIINIAVVTGSIPPTGLPLPFISAGSTSLVVFMSAIGILLNINKNSNSHERLINFNARKLILTKSQARRLKEAK